MRLLPLLLALAGHGAASVIIANSSVTSQVRVAYHGATGMTVSWNTFDRLDTPTVFYGLAADSLTEVATSDVSITYPTSLTYNNHVVLDGLQPDTLYYYQPQQMLANETVYGPYTFKTARPAGDFTPYTLAFVCDLGTMGPEGLSDIANKKTDANEVLKPGEQNTIKSLVSQLDTFDFVVHPGDLAYSDYWLKEELAGYINATIEEGPQVYETILDEFYDEMEAISAFKPYMIGVGNHEADCDNGGTGDYTASICVEGQTNFTGVRNHFRMPSDVSGGVGNFWYSFDYGMVHYVFFDTETDLGNGLLEDEQDPYFAGPFGSYVNEQVDWLAADLAAVDRCATPWVVALGHRPWFASGSHCANCSLAFADMFEEYAVDIVLQGHFHVYERDYPVFANGTLDPQGYDNPSAPWYIINGLGGHWKGMDTFDTPLEDFQAFGLDRDNATYGWSRLHFYNATHVRHEFVASNNNSVLDETVLYKDHVCAAPSAASSSALACSTGLSLPSASLNATKAATSAATTTAPSSTVTSTILSTTVYTVTSCAPTVTNCPVGHVTTDVITLYTTYCPESGVDTTAPASTHTPVAPTASTGYHNATTAAVTTTQSSGSGSDSGSGSSSSSSSSSSPASVSASTPAGAATVTSSTVVTAGAASLTTGTAGIVLALVAAAAALL